MFMYYFKIRELNVLSENLDDNFNEWVLEDESFYPIKPFNKTLEALLNSPAIILLWNIISYIQYLK